MTLVSSAGEKRARPSAQNRLSTYEQMHVEPSPGEPVQALTVLDNENLVWALTMLLGESASRRETNPSQMKIGGDYLTFQYKSVMVSVCPYAAYKRNEKLRQIGTDCKCSHPHAAGCLHGRIPDKRHLNKCRAKECDTLTGQEKKYSFLPAGALCVIHFTYPPVF